MPSPSSNLSWDIFCQVVDNHGDLGVCWRLSSQLASLGHHVRLWVDDAKALPWMAPGALQGRWPRLQVRPWPKPWAMPPGHLPAADVWIEAFGCEIPAEFVAHFMNAAAAAPTGADPVWINLEYLSAESYVERMHALPSPVMHGPGAGLTKWFFYPGFTSRTGGLLREPDLLARQATFDRAAWLSARGVDWCGDALLASLFCYEPAPMRHWLGQLALAEQNTHLMVTPGRATAAVQIALAGMASTQSPGSDTTLPSETSGQLTISYLPHLPQRVYDELLWACDLNFVRGEDSLVRALWAGKPFVWHIYPQGDDAHHAKLDAFLDWLGAPASLRKFHHIWNGIEPPAPDSAEPACLIDLPAWGACAQAARERLLGQADLITQITRFVSEKR